MVSDDNRSDAERAGEPKGKKQNAVDISLERKALQLILARLNQILTKENASRILQYVDTGAIRNQEHSTLLYLLNNLVSIYERTRGIEEKIRAFVRVVNEYLIDKEFVYDEIKCSLSVMGRRAEGPLNLENLSSGEKQIVSILSSVYLLRQRDCAIFLDEPELSLSMGWQRKLIPHIMDSGRCKFLLATTHSPFMFDNALENYTDSLRVKFYHPVLVSQGAT